MSGARSDAEPAAEAAGVERAGTPKVICNACPVLCQISEGRTGACDRWGNFAGVLTRVDPVVLFSKVANTAGAVTGFVESESWDGNAVREAPVFISGVGSGTTYPDYKPAPFIVSSVHEGVDMVTVVTEGIFSYCSFKVKIDTDRWLGPEQATVRCGGEAVGHVTTAEYGSQMLSLGGVHHLTGGSKKEGRVACEVMMDLGNRKPVELAIEGGAQLTIEAGKAPVVNGVEERRMRVGCGSATIGIFARQWYGEVDEVVVVDDHITGVLTEHQAGRCLDMPASGIKIRGKKSTPGRYFQVAKPGTGWGGTDITDPLSIVAGFDPRIARPGSRILMVSTTGEDAGYFVLDQALRMVPAPIPPAVQKVVERIGENCEPALTTVLFLAGAGGSLRAGVTDNPVRLTRSIKDLLVAVTCGGAPVYIWPGGGITLMVDVLRMPESSFGWVPTPAIVAPIEFTMRLGDYEMLGGHMDRVRSVADVLRTERVRVVGWDGLNPWPLGPRSRREA
jgi:hypothetical protein